MGGVETQLYLPIKRMDKECVPKRFGQDCMLGKGEYVVRVQLVPCKRRLCMQNSRNLGELTQSFCLLCLFGRVLNMVSTDHLIF